MFCPWASELTKEGRISNCKEGKEAGADRCLLSLKSQMWAAPKAAPKGKEIWKSQNKPMAASFS